MPSSVRSFIGYGVDRLCGGGGGLLVPVDCMDEHQRSDTRRSASKVHSLNVNQRLQVIPPMPDF